eukprot:gb/GEZN01007774.1/.p1 GENE.gb/GEZN01007774.1/~~gb/GEZN01007774.1/.p1  ORF type:complete len:325 (-),score=61.65 gb/GEZN01007774.1/:264-1238(-)
MHDQQSGDAVADGKAKLRKGASGGRQAGASAKVEAGAKRKAKVSTANDLRSQVLALRQRIETEQNPYLCENIKKQHLNNMVPRALRERQQCHQQDKARLETRLATAQEQIEVAKQQIAAAQRQIEIANRDVKDTQQTLADEESKLEIDLAKIRSIGDMELGELLQQKHTVFLQRFTTWSKEEVQQWVKHVAEGQFANMVPSFRKKDIDGKMLANLHDIDGLVECGVESLKTRKMLWPHVESLLRHKPKKKGGAKQARREPERMDECVVCMDMPRETILAPCGHASHCLPCATHLKENNLPCSVCRKPIESIVEKVYDLPPKLVA